MYRTTTITARSSTVRIKWRIEKYQQGDQQEDQQEEQQQKTKAKTPAGMGKPFQKRMRMNPTLTKTRILIIMEKVRNGYKQ